MKLLLILLFPLFSFSQTIKGYLPSIGFSFGAGLSDGLRDATMFRMDGKGNFWNGKQSWLNKYRNRDIRQGEAFLGSTTVFVAFTDGQHLANCITRQFEGMALAYIPEDKNKRFLHIFLKVASYNLIRQLGHTLVYDIIFKPQNRD